MINPFLRNLDSIGEYLSYPLIRFVTGILLIPHGYGKLYKGFNGNPYRILKILTESITLSSFIKVPKPC